MNTEKDYIRVLRQNIELREECQRLNALVGGEEEMKEKETGGNAFPVFLPSGDVWEGMTLRDYFAGQALIMLVKTEYGSPVGDIASYAYQTADAMLKERTK